MAGFRSPEEAALALELPLLGNAVSPAEEAGPVAPTLPEDRSTLREFHRAADRILLASRSAEGAIGVVGDVPSVRRARVVSFLAASLAHERSVILVDADLKGAHLSFDDRGKAQEGIVDVLRYGVRSPRVVAPTSTPGLNLLPVGSGTVDFRGTYESDATEPLFEELVRTGDLVIVNGPDPQEIPLARVFLRHVKAWVLLHELGQSESERTRGLRDTLGPERCLGILTLHGEPPPEEAFPAPELSAKAAEMEASPHEVVPPEAAEVELSAHVEGGHGSPPSNAGGLAEARPAESGVLQGQKAASLQEAGSGASRGARRASSATLPAPEPQARRGSGIDGEGSREEADPLLEVPVAMRSPDASDEEFAALLEEEARGRRGPMPFALGAGVVVLVLAAILWGGPGLELWRQRAPTEVVSSSEAMTPAGEIVEPPGTAAASGEDDLPGAVAPTSNTGSDASTADRDDSRSSGARTEPTAPGEGEAQPPPWEAAESATPTQTQTSTLDPGRAEDTSPAPVEVVPSGVGVGEVAEAEPRLSAPEQPASVDIGVRYAVHVSSFKTQGRARREATELEAAGYPVLQRSVEIPGKGTWIRVYVGPYTEREHAEKTAKEIRASGLRDYTRVQRVSDGTH